MNDDTLSVSANGAIPEGPDGPEGMSQCGYVPGIGAAASSSESSCASLQRQYGARYDAWRLSTDWCDRRRKIECRRSNHRCKHCVRAAGRVGLNV